MSVVIALLLAREVVMNEAMKRGLNLG